MHLIHFAGEYKASTSTFHSVALLRKHRFTAKIHKVSGAHTPQLEKEQKWVNAKPLAL